jgi:predicted transcriptional regulator
VRVRDVMTPDIEVLDPDDSLETAVRLLADLDLEALPVSENNCLIGTVTGRDIAMQIVVKDRDAADTTVGEVMSRDMLYCFEGERISDVARKMNEWWVRRLPVVNQNKRLTGMISLADVTILQPVAPASRESGGSSHRLRAARSQRRIRRNLRPAAAA